MADEPIPVTPGEPTPDPAQTPPAKPAEPDAAAKPQNDQDWYWKRQAEKAQKERDDAATKLKALEDEKLSEAERKEKAATEAKAKADAAERKALRYEAIFETGISKELAELVPEDSPDPKKFIEEKLLPLQSKLATPPLGNPTSPPPPGPDPNQAVIDQYDALKKAGVREEVLLQFYSEHADVLTSALSRR